MQEEEEEEEEYLKQITKDGGDVPTIVMTPDAVHMLKHYRLRAPVDSLVEHVRGGKTLKTNILHHRQHVEMYRNASGKELFECPLFFTNFQKEHKTKTVKVVAIGLVDFSCQGSASVGMTVKGGEFPCKTYMGNRKYTSVFLPGTFQCGAHQILFQTPPRTSIHRDNPQWTEEHATEDVEERKGSKSQIPHYFVPSSCPLALFQKRLNEWGTSTKTETESSGTLLTKDEYDEAVRKFKESVGDHRMEVVVNEFRVEIQPKTDDKFQLSLVFDLYYSI